jgi:sulfur-carrier protein
MRQFTNGAETLDLNGETVGDVLKALVENASGIEGRLFKGTAATSTLNRFVNIYVNDEDIRFLNNLETLLKPGDVISIVPAIAGG